MSSASRNLGLLLAMLVSSSLLFACGKSAGPIVDSSNPGFAMANGRLMLDEQPFTGVRLATLPAVDERHTTGYREGIQHGLTRVESLDGERVYAERRYFAGHRHGEQSTWHRDGKTLRSRSHYVYGKQQGDAWSWHVSGKPASFQRYDGNSAVIAEKRWRRTGQIYMNVVFHEGRAIGLPGSKVCDPIGTAKTPPG